MDALDQWCLSSCVCWRGQHLRVSFCAFLLGREAPFSGGCEEVCPTMIFFGAVFVVRNDAWEIGSRR